MREKVKLSEIYEEKKYYLHNYSDRSGDWKNFSNESCLFERDLF